MSQPEPSERTGCAIITAAMSCLTLSLTIIYYVIESAQLRRMPDGTDPGLMAYRLALFVIWSSFSGIVLAWLLALIAAIFRRKLIALLVIESPVLLFAVWQLLQFVGR